MEKYYTDLVNRGFNELHAAMVQFIVRELKRQYGRIWRDEVLKALNDQRDLPGYGDEQTLIDALDRANCCRLIARRYGDLFRDLRVGKSCRTWANELMSVRNLLAHDGLRDLPQKDAERYLDTMVRLASAIDADCAERIRPLYQEARSMADDMARPAPEGYYPEADQSADTDGSFDLLSIEDPEIVQLTGLSRKLTVSGETLAYPVYRVRLDKLYFNDRNDRILTWISQYKDETGVEDLSGLSREEYNRIIEAFIVKSNPASIEKTRNSIELTNQREPGVTLSDGRIIDGNRRFTCLRMIQRDHPEISYYFETVILADTPADSAKQIKLLELAIQHGEEQKVDYSQIDTAIGAYLDIEDTGLITRGEYAASTNETLGDVQKKLDIARLILEFLDFMRTPRQYHIARDMQVYSVFSELLQLLNKCKNDAEREALKKSVFTNTMLGTFADQRKYIRNLKARFGTQPYKTYIQRESKAAEQITQALEAYGIGGMEDLKAFIGGQAERKAELALSLEKALSQSRKAQTKNKPAKNVSKCIDLLKEIDTDIFEKLTPEEREALRVQLTRLADFTAMIAGELPDA